MTDIAVRADQQIDVPATGQPGTAALAQWVHAADAAYRLADGLCSTQFAPAAYRGKPQEAAAAILAGAEVGLSPMASLRAFDSINGTPAPKAITLRAIAQGLGHQVRIDESTPTRAVVSGLRKGDTDWQTSTWTIDRAQQMGLTGKQQWKQQPAAMLVARATAEVCRWIASDAIMGMPYTVEELRDQHGNTVPMSGRPAPRIVSAADFLPEPTARHDDPVEGEQLATLATLARFKGITDPDDGLALMSEITGRTVTGSRDLTYHEASRVIDHLRTLPDDDPAEVA